MCPHVPADEGEEGGEGEEGEGDAGERRAAARQAAVLRRAMRLLDADTLASQHLLPADQAIRERDLPERFQLAGLVNDPSDVSLLLLLVVGGGGVVVVVFIGQAISQHGTQLAG
jgi:hypothetical protein